jgi:hypothetical protein
MYRYVLLTYMTVVNVYFTLYYFYVFACLWHVPRPIVLWQSQGSMECILYCIVFYCINNKNMFLWPIHIVANSKTDSNLHVKGPIPMSDFNQILEFLGRFSQTCPISNFRESVLWETHAFRQADMTMQRALLATVRNSSTTNGTSYKYVLIQMRFKPQLSYTQVLNNKCWTGGGYGSNS